jgi:hypothetical protein
MNSAILDLPAYAKKRLFAGVFKGLQPERHPPRGDKQARLFRELATTEGAHQVGEIQFQRKGPRIIARPRR